MRIHVRRQKLRNFASVAERASDEFAVVYDSATESGSDVQVNEVVRPAADAVQALSDCRRVTVVLDPHRHLEIVSQQRFDVDVRPFVETERRVQRAGLSHERTRHADAGAEHARLVDRPAILQLVDELPELGDDLVVPHRRHRCEAAVQDLPREIHQRNGDRIPHDADAERVRVIGHDLDTDAKLPALAAGDSRALAQGTSLDQLRQQTGHGLLRTVDELRYLCLRKRTAAKDERKDRALRVRISGKCLAAEVLRFDRIRAGLFLPNRRLCVRLAHCDAAVGAGLSYRYAGDMLAAARHVCTVVEAATHLS